MAYQRSTLRRFAVGILCAKTAIVVLAFSPEALHVFSQPKALISHAFAYLLLGLLLALALNHRKAMLRWSPVHLPVIAYAATYVAASVFALDHRVAIFGSPDRSLGLIAALDCVLLYVALVVLIRDRSDLIWLAASLVASSGLVLGYEVLQALNLDPVNWSRPSSESLPATLGNRGVVAQYMGCGAIAAIALGIAPFYVDRRVRTLAIGIGVCLLGGAMLSGARAVLIGIAAGVAFLAATQLLKVADPRRRSILALVMLVLAGVAVPATITLTPAGQRIDALLVDIASVSDEGTIEQRPGSVTARLDIYRVAFEQLVARPLLGVGPDNYVVGFPEHRTFETAQLHDSQVPQSSTHSWLAKVGTDAGVLGLSSFILAIAMGIALGLRGRDRPWRYAASAGLVAFLGTGLVTVSHIATDWLPWLALGLIASPLVEPRVDATATPRTRAQARSGPHSMGQFGAIAIAAVVIAVVTVMGPIEASHNAKAARQLNSTSDRPPQLAIRAANEAVALDEGRAEYWSELGRAYLRAGEPAQASTAFQKSWERAPYQATYLASLARAQLNEAARGDTRARGVALDTAKRAAEIDTNVQLVQHTLAVAAAANGRAQEAIDAAELYLRLGGGPDTLITEAAAAGYLAIDRPTDAERWLRMIITSDESGTPRLRLLLARALVAQDRVGEALHVLDLVLAGDPQNEEALRIKDDLTGQ